MLHQRNAIIAAVLSPNTELVPNIGIMDTRLYRELVRTGIVMYRHLRVEKKRGIVRVYLYGNPSLPEVEVKVGEGNGNRHGIPKRLHGGSGSCVFGMPQQIMSDVVRLGDHIPGNELLACLISAFQRIVIDLAV